MEHRKNPEPFLIELLINSYSWFVQELNLALETSGKTKLTRAQIILLYYLDDGKDRALSLSKKMGLSRQAISLTLRELEKAGIVKLIPDPLKKSAKIIRKTAKGRQSVDAAYKALHELEDKIAKRIGRRKLDNLRALLKTDWG